MIVNDIPLNVGLIDSLTIYLDLKEIDVLDNKLVDKFQPLYPNTGEILDEVFLNPRPIPIQYNGVNFRFNKVVYPPNKNNPETTELIRLTLTSKMLFNRYFDGINLSNIGNILDFVRSQNIIDFDDETALNSLCNDIDICQNYRLEFEAYKSAMYFLRKHVKENKQHKVTLVSPRKTESLSKNYGLMYGDRNKGSVSSPFCKFYNKSEELLKNSADFYNTYIFPQLKYGLDPNNIVRKEVTIRNLAFKRALKRKGLVSSENDLKTLKDILSISQDQLTTISNEQLKCYYEKRKYVINDDLSPTDRLIAHFMHRSIILGDDKEEIMKALNLFDTKNEKVQKSQSKKRIEKIYNTLKEDNYVEKQLQKNTISNEFLRMQQIW